MSESDLAAILLTLKLATVTTLILLIVCLPYAWWLSRTRFIGKPILEALTALPLVLPPTVLGFYFLIFFNPNSVIGEFVFTLTQTQLTFSFTGLVVASLIYSLPFMVQPLQVAFSNVSQRSIETAASLGLNRAFQFVWIAIPQSLRGVFSAIVLTFAHTVGEFGVVLMVGGNIPGETRVVSIAIYEHVEVIAYDQAHLLAAVLLVFSFAMLATVYLINRQLPLNRF
ncbi:molybdate ABC transporter permease subunit [Candidatus Poribacteria bacterium]|nr:MAG: molybdate ABC transporter permease subunit [Candidatus Poribacteria bacterium]